MAEVLAGCPEQDLPGGASAARAGASSPAPSAPVEVYYPNCDAVREAGAAPLRADEPGYRPALDRGGEPGVACED